MSMGFWVKPETAMIWRGPMCHKYLTVFLTQIPWGELDYLVIDLAPGTGDAQLTLTQTAPLSGAVIVTTPQDVSLIDARKGTGDVSQVRVPVLGIVENMSYFTGADGKALRDLSARRRQEARPGSRRPVPGEIPIEPKIAECGDTGDPIVHKYPDNAVSKTYVALAGTIAEQINKWTSETGELPHAETVTPWLPLFATHDFRQRGSRVRIPEAHARRAAPVRKVRVWTDKLHVIDVNKDCFEIRGVGIPTRMWCRS